MSFLYVVMEVLLGIATMFAIWYAYFRPRSKLNRRPAYTSLKTPSEESSFDYIVIGGGPGGLAAARQLIESGETAPSVLLVDMGDDAVPVSTSGVCLKANGRNRLTLCAYNMVNIPRGVVPGEVGNKGRRSYIDNALVAQRPLRPPVPPNATEASIAARPAQRKMQDVMLTYAAFPRGSGIGGTAQLDWGVHTTSILDPTRSSTDGEHADATLAKVQADTARPWWRLPVRLALTRSPLSWTFGDAAGEVIGHKYMATEEVPLQRDSVSPAYLRLDVDGKRLPISCAIMDGLPAERLKHLHVLSQCLVTELCMGKNTGSVAEVNGSAETHSNSSCKVEAVMLRMIGQKQTIKVRVGKGVVVAAGSVHTPTMLHTALASAKLLDRAVLEQHLVYMRDAVALPLIFKTHKGISSDRCNVGDIKSLATWWLTQRGPLLTPLTDTVASISVPELGARAEVLIFLLPIGGRDPLRYFAMGWDRVLASYQEALTMVMVLRGVDGLEHVVDVDPSGALVGKPAATETAATTAETDDAGAAKDAAAAPGAKTAENQAAIRSFLWRQMSCPIAPFSYRTAPLPSETRDKVRTAFRAGIRVCRKIVATPPLSSLTPGMEAIDFAMLKEEPSKALRLARLVHTPFMKLTRGNQEELLDLTTWASHVAKTDKYLNDYIDSNTYWFGTASGSSESYLENARPTSAPARSGLHPTANFKVKNVANAVVGDCSVVTHSVWAEGKMDNFAAGSVATAVSAGRYAASQLIDMSQ